MRLAVSSACVAFMAALAIVAGKVGIGNAHSFDPCVKPEKREYNTPASDIANVSRGQIQAIFAMVGAFFMFTRTGIPRTSALGC